MRSQAELINDCLEILAEKTEDLAPDVYKRFFSLYPQGEALFGADNTDIVKGGMIVSLLQEFMRFSEGEVYRENVKRWVADHKGYGVTESMYADMFACLMTVIKSHLGDDWTPEMQSAWQKQYQTLEEFIRYIYTPGNY